MTTILNAALAIPFPSAAFADTQKTCGMQGCNTNVKARGWCNKHYHRWNRNGSPYVTKVPTRGLSLQEKFAYYVIRHSDGCWGWKGYCLNDGYTQLMHQGRKFMGHIVSFEIEKGPIPVGLSLDHLCRTRRCTNPEPLEPITIPYKPLP